MLIGIRRIIFIHYIEEKVGVEYRFLKPFTAGYTDEKGNFSERTYSMYVRHLGKQSDVLTEPVFVPLSKAGGLESVTNYGCRLELISMRKIYDIVEEDIIILQTSLSI